MMFAKQITAKTPLCLLGAAALLVIGGATSMAQTLAPAQVLRVKQVYKPETADSPLWTVEVENTSQNVITAYGVSMVCHYPDGTTKESGVRTFDLGPLLAGRAGIMAQIEYLRSARPEAVSAVNPGEDPSFGPGATRRDTFSPPTTVGGIVPDSVIAAPAAFIFDDGTYAGNPDDLAFIFSERRDELTKRTLLIDDLRLIEASADRAGKLEERLNVLATTLPSSLPAMKPMSRQTQILLDNPENRRTWQRQQLLVLKRLVGSADSSALKPVILHYEAEAAVYARLSKYAGQ
jgi:hypothetical protein